VPHVLDTLRERGLSSRPRTTKAWQDSWNSHKPATSGLTLLPPACTQVTRAHHEPGTNAAGWAPAIVLVGGEPA